MCMVNGFSRRRFYVEAEGGRAKGENKGNE